PRRRPPAAVARRREARQPHRLHRPQSARQEDRRRIRELHRVMADGAQLEQILAPISAWARSRADIHGLALVGSWARESARRDSDIDLVLVVPDPQKFRFDEHWLTEIDWAGGRVADWHDADYGSAFAPPASFKPHFPIRCT